MAMITMLVVTLVVTLQKSVGHQSIGDPTPISYLMACRVGMGVNCPGPCPNQHLRKDQSPATVVRVVRRGGLLRVKTYKNNHVGGLARWSIVSVGDMYNRQKHTAQAFHYGCADVGLTKCTYETRDLCRSDDRNEHYFHRMRVPMVYPDGVYVLGFVWYGGLVRAGTHGAFGDYYDCAYIRIQGGPLRRLHQPTFYAKGSVFGRLGFCSAMTDRVGECFREPCPGGPKAARLVVPREFAKGRKPRQIRRNQFK